MGVRWPFGAEIQTTATGFEFDTVVGTIAISASAARSGDRGLRCTVPALPATGSYVEYSINAVASGHLYIVFCTQIQTAPASLTKIFEFAYNFPSYTARVSIRMNNSGTLELWREDGTPAQIGSDSSAISGFNSIICLDLDITNITAALYLNGTQVASGSYGATGTGGTFRVGVLEAVQSELDFDDVLAWDSAGSYVNTLAPYYRTGVRIVYGYPTGNGDTQNGARGGADSGTNYGQVDENPPNDITDYWRMNVDEDIFEVKDQVYGPVYCQAYNAEPAAVCVGLRNKTTVSGRVSETQPRIKSQSAGTVVTGTSIFTASLSWLTNGGGFKEYLLISYTDPQNGGAWNRGLLSTAQFGVRYNQIVAADGTDVSTLWLMMVLVPRSIGVMKSGGMVPHDINRVLP